MSLPLSVLTQLDAVNICLSAMGEPEINSLDDAAVDAQMVLNILDEVTRSVQSVGWNWNTEKHSLAPTSDSTIVLPENTIRVVPIEGDAGADVVQRGLKLFDKTTNSFTFAKPLRIEITVILSYDDLPFSAKQFIAVRAARVTQQRLLGSDTLYKFDQADENQAWGNLMSEEAETLRANVLQGNWSTASILNRSYFARGAFR